MSDPASVRISWDVAIPLRDGIRLSAILYLPEKQERPGPAIFLMTPYIAQRHHERGKYFAAHGYPFLSVDVRGRGNSQGAFHPLNEAADGYDVVEWLARQPYCNGDVAMCGGSYLGYCQWATAAQRPPHLRTIVPVASAFFGVDFPLRGNIFGAYTIQWLTHVSGRTLQEKLFADREFWRGKFRGAFESGTAFRELDALVGNPCALFQEWISHPQRDDYWDRYNPSAEQYANLSMPILTITGAYDADQLGALEHYRQHMKSAPAEERARHYLIIGPWDHAGCAVPNVRFGGITLDEASIVDLQKVHCEWYAWTMQGAAKPEFLQRNVAYYVIGSECWRYAGSLEAVTSRREALYLHATSNPSDVFASGLLGAGPGNAGPDCYIYDPTDLRLAQLESFVDPSSLVDQQLVNAATERQLIYHSMPFSTSAEICGFFRLGLWLSIDQPDTDVRATIYEVALDGSTVRLTVDWVRARYRESDRLSKPVDTTRPLRYDFDRFPFVARRIATGSRLRLVIGPINSIFWQKNYNSGGSAADESMVSARPVTVRLFHDAAHPSVLQVPIGQHNSVALVTGGTPAHV